MKVSLLSNETNSLDPLAIHSRIFVGNLNTFQCSKSDVEQIFQRYGNLTAISMHKGYAFVQFSNPVEAKSAAEGEDGRLVLNQNIDVNLVSQPKIHQQQVTAKHMFPSSRLQSTTTAALKLSNSRFQHLMGNGAVVAAVAAAAGVGGGPTQPKLSVSIQRRRKRRRNQLKGIRSEFLMDTRMSGGSSNLMLVANQYSGISPTLSSASSSSSLSSNSSTGSSASSSSAAAGQQVAEFQNYVAANQNQSHHPLQQQQSQWYPGCYLSGLNINNNYLIPTPVYDNHPNEVIDGAPQHSPPGVCTEETQEIVFYDGNNNPISNWEEFISTTNKNGPDRGDILICGNCRELFNDLKQYLLHRSIACQLRVFCECRKMENTVLLCFHCRKEFSQPLALLQHMLHVHQIKIFEEEHDYNHPDKDLATHEELCDSISSPTPAT